MTEAVVLLWLTGWFVALALVTWANVTMNVPEWMLNAGILFGLWPIYLWAIARGFASRSPRA